MISLADLNLFDFFLPFFRSLLENSYITLSITGSASAFSLFKFAEPRSSLDLIILL